MTTRVPDLEDALVSLFTATLPGVTIILGPLIARQVVSPDVARVSSQFDEVSQASSMASRVAEGWDPGQVEALSVVCSLASSSGGQDVMARRDRVKVMFGAVDDALRADQTLDGLVAASGITEERWVYVGDEQGVACDLTFMVSARAFI